MAQSSSPPSRRIPQQRRSRELVAAIRQAALLILEESGPDALTTNRIAERAGVSIGSLYHYFSNKEAIVAEIYEGLIQGEMERAAALTAEAERLQSLPPADAIRLLVEMSTERHRRFLGIHRAFYQEHGREIDFANRIESGEKSYRDQAIEWIRLVLGRHRGPLVVSDTDRAAELIVHIVDATLIRAVEHSPELLADGSFAEDMIRLMLAYLYCQPSQH
jgi:AcrR family transcriptional regulator